MNDWRCTECNTLLGRVLASGEVEIQYKGVSYRVRGVIKTTCRRCKAPASHSSS